MDDLILEDEIPVSLTVGVSEHVMRYMHGLIESVIPVIR